MSIVFFLFLTIDVLAAFFLFRLAFVQRSNMNRKYKRRFALLLAMIGGAMLFYWTNLSLACLIAGIPASLVILFFGGLAIAMFMHKGPWH